MKIMRRFSGIALAAAGTVMSVLCLIIKIKKPLLISSVSGPDGPTAVISSVEINGSLIIAGIITGVILLAGGIFLAARKK